MGTFILTQKARDDLLAIAQETGLTRQGIQHALSRKGNPRFDNVNSIMNALGYRLVPEKLDNGKHI